MAILAIVFSHSLNMIYFNRLPSNSSIKWLFDVLAPSGVAIFLFLSGYGNNLSIKKKMNLKWIKDKCLKLYIPTAIVILFTFLGSFILNIKSLFPQSYSIIKDIICLTQPPFSSWYLKVQLLAYITLYFCFLYFKRIYAYVFFLLWVCFVIFAIVSGKHSCWWVSTLCLPLGVFCAEINQLLKKRLNGKIHFYSILFLSVNLVLFLSIIFFNNMHYTVLGFVALMSLCITICLSMIPMGYSIELKSKVLYFFGTYSLEIYLVHLAYISLFEKLTYINPDIKICLILIMTVFTVKGLKNTSNNFINKILERC